MAVINGVVASGAVLAANVKPDIDQVLRVLEPYQTPFTTYLMFINKNGKEVKNKYGKFTWFEKIFLPHKTKITAAITESSGLTLTASNVDDVTFFNIGDMIIIEETGQMAVVSSGTVGTSVVLTHIDGSTSLTSLATVGSIIRVVGSENYEYTATSGRNSLIQKEEEQYNYLNIFKKIVTTSGREEAGEAYTDGLSHDELVEQEILQLKLEVERYLMLSPLRGYKSSGNERVTYGYGLDGVISSNVVPYSGDLSEKGFDSYLKGVYQKGSNRKVHFAGSDQMEDIEAFMKDRYSLQQNPGQKSIWQEYGMEAKTYRTFSGLTTLVWNPILDGKYADYGFTIDEKHIKLRYMAADKRGARKFRIRPVETLRNDGAETEILMDLGIEIGHESVHGKLYKA